MSRRAPFYQPFLYWTIRSFAQLLFKTVWRLKIVGTGHIPKRGGVIIAANGPAVYA